MNQNSSRESGHMDLAMDVAIRLAFVGLIVLWCTKIITPFFLPLLWGLIIAVALYPVFLKLKGWFGGRNTLAGQIINFTSKARTKELILHTSVTIGYDVPWRQVHELLLAATESVENLMKEPEPFVLQKGLNDFYIEYELNAYTDKPRMIPATYSELHQNIQDRFVEAGVEILSPHYRVLRHDGLAAAE